MTQWLRVAASLAGMVVVSGCVGGGPTYGTGKTSTETLLDDLGNSVSLGAPKPTEEIKYEPRPALVMPASKDNLVTPQKSLAGKDNPNWVESPEEARLRLKKEADDNIDNPGYKSPLLVGTASGAQASAAQQQQAYRDARKLQMGAYSDKRRYLSDPPLEYRKVDDATALNDLGEPELDKARRRKKMAVVEGSGKKWWQF